MVKEDIEDLEARMAQFVQVRDMGSYIRTSKKVQAKHIQLSVLVGNAIKKAFMDGHLTPEDGFSLPESLVKK